jgi:hypothetical protein
MFESKTSLAFPFARGENRLKADETDIFNSAQWCKWEKNSWRETGLLERRKLEEIESCRERGGDMIWK